MIRFILIAMAAALACSCSYVDDNVGRDGKSRTVSVTIPPLYAKDRTGGLAALQTEIEETADARTRTVCQQAKSGEPRVIRKTWQNINVLFVTFECAS